jgi:hypothetical protein
MTIFRTRAASKNSDNNPMQIFHQITSVAKKNTLFLQVTFGFTFFYYLCFLYLVPSGMLIAPGDGWREFVPVFYVQKSLWTDLICTGYPQIGDPQIQFFYPLTLIFQLFHSYNAFIISAFVLASCFAYLFAYTLTRSKLSGLFSGLCFGMSGFFMVHLEHASMIHAGLWTPLILTAIEKIRQNQNAGWLIIGSTAVFMTTLGGHPQISVYGLGLSCLYALYVGISKCKHKIRYFITVFLMFLLGFGLAAIQIIPALEWTKQSTRASLSHWIFIHSHSLSFLDLWQLIYPNLSSTFYSEAFCYVGIVPLLFLFMALLLKPHQQDFHNKDLLFWLFIAILSVCLMLGKNTPLAEIMYHMPVYNLFRIPCRHGLEFSVAISTITGLMIIRSETCNNKKLLFKYGVISCGLTIAMVAIGTYLCRVDLIAYTKAPDFYNIATPPGNRAFYIPAAIVVASAAALLIWLKDTSSTWRKILFAIVFSIDLFVSSFWFGKWYPLIAPPQSVIDNPPPIATYISKLLKHNGQRLLALPTYEHLSMDLALNGLAPNLSLLWNVPVTGGYPLRLKRYVELTGLEEFSHTKLVFDPVGSELDLAATRYLLYPNIKIPNTYPSVDTHKYKKVADLGVCTVYENLAAMPRAWLAGETIILPAQQILQTVHSSKLPNGSPFVPGKTALLEDGLAAKLRSDITDAEVQILKLDNHCEEFRTSCSKPAMLVVSDLFYPGWEVKIDGQHSKIYMTDYTFRGVFLEPGKHQVKFTYKPKSLYWGIAVSILSLVSLLVLTLILSAKLKDSVSFID